MLKILGQRNIYSQGGEFLWSAKVMKNITLCPVTVISSFFSPRASTIFHQERSILSYDAIKSVFKSYNKLNLKNKDVFDCTP